MKKIIRGVIPFVLALSIISIQSPAQSRSEESQLVPLEKVMKHPKGFRHVLVSFVAQFHSLGQLDNPVHTRFETDWYQNFSVWPDSSPLWVKSAYAKDFPYLFIKRLSEGAKIVAHAAPYSRWVITGKVTDDFGGVPWIEVLGMEALDHSLDPVSLRHLIKAFRHQRANQFNEAAAAFHAAEHKGLTMSVRSMAMREEALSLHRAGHTELGIARLVHACRKLDDDPANVAALTSLRAAMGLDPDGHPLPAPPPGQGMGVNTNGTPQPPMPMPMPPQPQIVSGPVGNPPPATNGTSVPPAPEPQVRMDHPVLEAAKKNAAAKANKPAKKTSLEIVPAPVKNAAQGTQGSNAGNGN